MKTPAKPTRIVVLDDTSAHLPLVLPWGAWKGRVAVEQQVAMARSPVRRQLKETARKAHPGGKVLARQDYFVNQRALPGGVSAAARDPRQAARVKAARARIARTTARLEPPAFKAKAAAAVPLWREIGPTLIPHGQTYGKGAGAMPSVSGRCSGIVVDRNDSRHLVLCSAGGGLWGTYDAGATWASLTDTQPTLRMGAIAQSPSAPAFIYAATGDGDGSVPYGVGLLRSSDGGKSWALAPSPKLQGVGSFDLAVAPQDPLAVFIATDQGLYVSPNGGDTVRLALDGICWSVSVHPTIPGEVFAAQRTGLMRSTNGGATWKKVPLAGTDSATQFSRLEVCHAPGKGAVVYVAGTVDDGDESANDPAFLWRRATQAGAFRRLQAPGRLDTSQSWYDWCFNVSPADADVVVWGAIELYRGRHAGGKVSWTNVSSKTAGDSIHPDQHFVAFDPNQPGAIYACNDGGVYRSPDLGASWVSLNPGLGITEFEYVAQLAGDATWLMGGTQDNGSLTLAGARRWDQIALGDGGDCAAVDRGTASICYHSYYDMPIERAPAHGSQAFRWQEVSPPVGDGYPALFYPPMDAKGSAVAKAGSTVWVSDDEGANWTEIALPTSAAANPDLATALNFVGDKMILVGMASGRIWKLSRGQGWASAKPQALASLPVRYVSDMCIVGASAQVIWATSSRFGGGHVFNSVDGGATFKDCSGALPDVPVNAITVDSQHKDTVYIGTDRGVYRTMDAGKHWNDISNGLPNVIVGALLFHEQSRTLRAGTRNRGAWELAV